MGAFFNWLKSPEGPFSRKPKWLRRHVMNIANQLGVGIYELKDWQRALFGQYVALHSDECLFLVARIDLELEILCKKAGINNQFTPYVIQRLFGSEGEALIGEAIQKFGQDKQSVNKARNRAVELVAASIDMRIMKEASDYQAGLLAWEEMPKTSEPKSESQRAYEGLHYKYFSHLFISEEFKKWLDVQLKGIYAAEALGRIGEVMHGASSGKLSGKEAAKIIGAKFNIK